jgi:fibronectin-binding autotransporter adhesin
MAPLAFVAYIASSAVVSAIDYTWVGADNDWSKASNWSSSASGVPGSGANRIQIGVSGANGSRDYNQRAIYSAPQGTTTLTGGGADRALVIGNGGEGHLEISGGSLISTSKSGDIMANSGGKAYLYVTGGLYQKLTAPEVSGSFSLNYSNGTSYLEIGGTGRFEVTTLDLQNATGGDGNTKGVVQLNTGGTLAVQHIGAGQTLMGTRTFNLNGGTIEALGDASWAAINGVTWNLESASKFNIGYTVTLANSLGGVGGFTKSGGGTFRLSGSNTYLGETIVTDGALAVLHNNALGATGANNGTFVQGGRIALSNGVTVTGEALRIQGLGDNQGALQAGSGATATWAGDVTLVGAGETRIGAGSGGHLIVAGNIDATASSVFLGIRVAGTDATTGSTFDNTAVTLGGTFTGSGIRLIQGVVKLGASDRIQDSAGLVFGHDTVSSLRQRFDLNGYNETVAYVRVDLTGSSLSNEITNSSATSSLLTLNSSGVARTFSGVVTGNLGIEKLGTNAVTFSGINTYTGNTQVAQGTFNIADGGALNGGGSVSVASGATFNLNSLGTLLFNIGENGVNNTITGAGSVNLQGILNFNLASADIALGNAWDVLQTTGSVNGTGLRVTSSAGDFTDEGGIWTLLEGGRNWSFNQSTGVLSLTAIPEPTSGSLVMIGGGAVALLRRRKKSAPQN